MRWLARSGSSSVAVLTCSSPWQQQCSFPRYQEHYCVLCCQWWKYLTTGLLGCLLALYWRRVSECLCLLVLDPRKACLILDRTEALLAFVWTASLLLQPWTVSMHCPLGNPDWMMFCCPVKQGVQRAASPWCTLGIRSCRTFCSDLA